MDIEKGNKYAKTALRISYLALILFIITLMAGKLMGIIGLLACLISYEYAHKAKKNGTTELKKMKTAKLISGIVAGISVLFIILYLLMK